MTALSSTSWAATWGRRAASIPTYYVLAFGLVCGAPLWLGATLLMDTLSADLRRAPRTRALSFLGLYLACEVFGVAVAAAIWLVTLGGRVGGRERYVDANYALQSAWSTALFRGSLFLFSMKVEIEGGHRVAPGPVILLVRHSSAADTALTAALVANPLGFRLRYVLKRELLWDPCLDIVGRRLPNAFVDRTAHDLAKITALTRGLEAQSGVLIYPEGTRFSAEKLTRGVARMRERDDPLWPIAAEFHNVLPPRTGGALALMRAAPEAAVVFVDHRGFEAAASFADFWHGGLIGQTLSIRLRRYESSSIPREAQDVWLYERWVELDEWLTASERGEGRRQAMRQQ